MSWLQFPELEGDVVDDLGSADGADREEIQDNLRHYLIFQFSVWLKQKQATLRATHVRVNAVVDQRGAVRASFFSYFSISMVTACLATKCVKILYFRRFFLSFIYLGFFQPQSIGVTAASKIS